MLHGKGILTEISYNSLVDILFSHLNLNIDYLDQREGRH